MFSAPDTRTQLICDNDGHILFRYNRTIFFCFVFFLFVKFFFLFFSFIGANRSRLTTCRKQNLLDVFEDLLYDNLQHCER